MEIKDGYFALRWFEENEIVCNCFIESSTQFLCLSEGKIKSEIIYTKCFDTVSEIQKYFNNKNILLMSVLITENNRIGIRFFEF